MRLLWQPVALADLEEMRDYGLGRWGVARTDAYLRDVRAKAELVAAWDLSGTRADDVRPGLRRQVVGSHVIWFRVEGDRLLVIRVLHQSRDAGRWMG